MAQKQLRAQATVYQALSTFAIGSRIIRRGDTVVAGHPYLKGREQLFQPFTPTYGEVPAEPEPEVETPESPGEQAGA
jgi:hypothetical protein